VHLVDPAVIQVRAERRPNGIHFAPVDGTPYYFDMQKGLRWWPVFKAKSAALEAVVKASGAGNLWMEITGYNQGDGTLGTDKSPFYVQIFAALRGRCQKLLSSDADMVPLLRFQAIRPYREK
jgi:hypothetical protein